jgi:hypothetical protein
MTTTRDIDGVELREGDMVYYATKQRYGAKSLLVKGTITKITSSGNVKIDNSYLSTNPEDQIALIESRTRTVLIEKT